MAIALPLELAIARRLMPECGKKKLSRTPAVGFRPSTRYAVQTRPSTVRRYQLVKTLPAQGPPRFFFFFLFCLAGIVLVAGAHPLGLQ